MLSFEQFIKQSRNHRSTVPPVIMESARALGVVPSSDKSNYQPTPLELAVRLTRQVQEAHRLVISDPTGAARQVDKRISFALLNIAFLCLLNMYEPDYQPGGSAE